MEVARKILSAPRPIEVLEAAPPVKGKAAAKAPPTKAVSVATPVPEPPATAETLNSEAFSRLEESEKKRDQVELMRDRKILDVEGARKKIRESRESNLALR